MVTSAPTSSVEAFALVEKVQIQNPHEVEKRSSIRSPLDKLAMSYAEDTRLSSPNDAALRRRKSQMGDKENISSPADAALRRRKASRGADESHADQSQPRYFFNEPVEATSESAPSDAILSPRRLASKGRAERLAAEIVNDGSAQKSTKSPVVVTVGIAVLCALVVWWFRYGASS